MNSILQSFLNDEMHSSNIEKSCQQNNISFDESAIKALIVNDIFGGKIMIDDLNHYFNIVDNQIIDCKLEGFKDIKQERIGIEEIKRESLLSTEEVKKRYLILLKNFIEKIQSYLFEKINGEFIQYKKELGFLFNFNNFEIIKYEKNEGYELVIYDLAAQNTGNIFEYKYYYENKNYELCSVMMNSFIDTRIFLGIRREVLDHIFDIARNNQELLTIEQKLVKIRDSKSCSFL